jgi:hypothetical protein
MKRLSLLFALLALAVPAIFANVATAATAQVFTASLNGAAENPGVVTAGTGDVQIVINAAETAVSFSVSSTNLSGPVVAAHIHIGAVGKNGPIMLPFTVGSGTLRGTLTAANLQKVPGAQTFAAALDAIRSGNAYVNLHTAAHPGGEVRGQLWASRTLKFFGGTLSGAQEVPSVSGSATGTAQILVDTQNQVVHYLITYSGLSGDLVAAHIHFGDPSISGPIMIPFKVGESPIVGTLTQANFQKTDQAPTWADALNAIRTGHAYVNMHTAAHPSGEVRANLRP